VHRVIRPLALVFTLFCASAATTAHKASDPRLEEAQRYFRTAELAEDASPVKGAAYAKAEALAAQLVAADSTNAEAHFLLFAAQGRRLLHESGRPSVTNFWKYADVNAHLDRALELNPRHANALAAKGGILIDLPAVLGGDPEVGRQMLERAVQLNPTGLGTRVTLARALLAKGARDDARQHLLLAAHYACRKREAAPLVQAEGLLAKLPAGSS
jgi:hypothetical protein